MPEGWIEVDANGETLQAKFVKVAVKVVTRPDASEENVLPGILRGGSARRREGRGVRSAWC